MPFTNVYTELKRSVQDKPFHNGSIVRWLGSSLAVGFVKNNLSNYRSIQLSNWRQRRQGLPFRSSLLRAKEGFTLIEILISLVLVGILMTMLFAASGTLFTKRRSDLQATAAKVASKNIETLRNQAFASLVNTPTSLLPCPASLDSYKLPNCQIRTTVYDYSYSNNNCSTSNTANLKCVNVYVSWTEQGLTKSLTMDTLIYNGGI